MSAVLNFNQRFETEVCCNCGVVFAMLASLQQNRRDDKKLFYCPNGHPQHYGKSEADRLREQLQQANASMEWQRARAQRLEKDLQSQKGQMTKLKNRIAKGVCPCCQRSFTNVARHMKTKHPDYSGGSE